MNERERFVKLYEEAGAMTATSSWAPRASPTTRAVVRTSSRRYSYVAQAQARR